MAVHGVQQIISVVECSGGKDVRGGGGGDVG